MTLQDFIQKVAADSSVDARIAGRVIRATMANIKGQLDGEGTAKVPSLGVITSRPKKDGSGEKVYILRRAKPKAESASAA
jgi:nucleoid DNA-binding protein